MKKGMLQNLIGKVIVSLCIAWILFRAGSEFYQIAWGTGTWRGEFSLKWGITYYLFIVICALIWLAITAGLFFNFHQRWAAKLTALRQHLGFVGWVLAVLAIIFPVWLLQYTPWGVVFGGFYLRLLIWCASVLVCGFLITRGHESALNFPGLLLAFILTGLVITLVAPFVNVTDYPFSLGWSEGNRLWDYSLLFGKARYIYDTVPYAYLDFGRQLNGGVPFLLPTLTIAQERFWIALMAVLPYVVLGILSFHLPKMDGRFLPLLAGLWAYLFVNQGPVHAPLLWSAILVAIAWRRPLWLAMPLVAVSAYFAQASRFTWLFAPAMWIGMLELADACLEWNRIPRRGWIRAISLAAAGLFGGYIVPKLPTLSASGAGATTSAGVTPSAVTSAVQEQPLLWYRLLPNATYGNGILLGLLFAVGPLVIVLLYLAITRRWVLNFWQKAGVVSVLLAFFAVGVVVSTKIGGGGDLHNMDMFIIGMMFAAALAWGRGGPEWLESTFKSPAWMRVVLILLVALPVVQPLRSLYPLSFSKDVERLATLADVQNTRALGSLPSDQVTVSSLQTIRTEVENAKTAGEVLFMDQRQLLTFGYIRDVKLVPEYEKKRMMDEALSSNRGYFETFYADLAAGRFVLIITEPLRKPVKDSSYQFGEENNAWVKWVANPVLCYYEPKVDLKEVGVQLLVPRSGPVDCTKKLP